MCVSAACCIGAVYFSVITLLIFSNFMLMKWYKCVHTHLIVMQLLSCILLYITKNTPLFIKTETLQNETPRSQIFAKNPNNQEVIFHKAPRNLIFSLWWVTAN